MSFPSALLGLLPTLFRMDIFTFKLGARGGVVLMILFLPKRRKLLLYIVTRYQEKIGRRIHHMK